MNIKVILLAFVLVGGYPIVCGNVLSREQIFTSIYNDKVWASSESLSGAGSDIATTKTLRMLLPMIVRIFNIEVLVDLGCGDFNWFKTLSLDVKNYIGVDIVKSVIESNKQKYASDNRLFFCLDAAENVIPQGDLVLCKDVLQHLSFQDCKKVIKNIKKSGAQYLLATTYLITESNTDIQTGRYGSVNLLRAPFNFPEPLLIFREMFAEDSMFVLRKSLALWEVKSLPDF